MENLRISTITSVLHISELLDLQKIYDQVPITNYIPFIEFGENNPPRGFSKKLVTKKRKNKQRKIFFNQETIHIVHEGKIVNVKLFNNGRIQITGLKNIHHDKIIIHSFLDYLFDIDVIDKEIEIVKNELVLINSDFSLGFEINRNKLHREIINSGVYSSFEPCIYPGVNIKYYVNTNNKNGICCCESKCDGKGRANGDGKCKKVTIAVFKSGKIIITGGQSYDQIEKSYYFITNFINQRPDYFKIHH